MSRHLIDYTRHPVSAAQALEQILRLWKENKTSPIVLVSERGQVMTRVNNIRSYLSKMRNRFEDSESFGFTCSDVFAFTLTNGQQGEATVLYYRLTPLQNITNIFNSIDAKFDAKVEK